ncbi:hypothetical protein KZO60_05825 [Prevotella nanceiensis]|uniref:hypothetical protein n=2 Tax=Hoylesella nanceiensis TaxID=425941 RepID=UPI001C5F3803|nr:hypothetical protein [Hoylesella nanceiensis]MBW4767234.1 hypothetical protein [Hoylesella nanceiensis]
MSALFIGLSRPSVIKVRKGLTRRRFISFTEGMQNSKPPQYMLLFENMNVTAVVTAHESILKDKDKNNISIKNGKRKDEYTKRRGYDATHAPAEEFEAPFPTSHGAI